MNSFGVHEAETVHKLVVSLPIFQKSKVISCYLSMPTELDTSKIIHEILISGKLEKTLISGAAV